MISQSQQMPQLNREMGNLMRQVPGISQSVVIAPNPMLARPPLTNIYILQKDSKNVLSISIPSKTFAVHKTLANTSFPHNFQFVNGPTRQLYMVGGGDY